MDPDFGVKTVLIRLSDLNLWYDDSSTVSKTEIISMRVTITRTIRHAIIPIYTYCSIGQTGYHGSFLKYTFLIVM